MNKSKHIRNEKDINRIIDECRSGNFNNLPKLYNAYINILNGFIKLYKIEGEDVKKIQDYFYDSLKLFARYETDYNIIPYIYDRLESYNKKSEVVIQDYEDNTFKEKEKEVISPKVDEYYKKYSYLIKKYVRDYDLYLKHDAVTFAQELLKKSINDMLESNIEINEIRLNKYFNNFDYMFKENLGNIDFILDDIKNGKDNYINIVFNKYKYNIDDINNEISGNEYSYKIFTTYIKRIVDNYNKGILNPDSSINQYILNGLEEIKKELKYDNIKYIINSIKNGKTEYIYYIISLYKSNIDKALISTIYDKNIIKKFCEKIIIEYIYDYIQNIDKYEIKNLKNRIVKSLENIDKKYYLYVNKIPDIKIKTLITKIRKGKFELIETLVEYYKNKLKLKFEYTNAEKDLVDNLLKGMLTVDINKFLFNDKYKYSFSLNSYIKKRMYGYKEILYNYIVSIENRKINLIDAINLAKTNKEYIYILYKKYEYKADNIIGEILDYKLDSKYDKMKNNILYNSIKNYVLSNDTPSIKELYNKIYLDFMWLQDIDNKNKVLKNNYKN